MAADAHITGTIYLAHGTSVQDYEIIAALDSEVADNAAGSEPYYLVPEGSSPGVIALPRNDGIPYGLPAGPHVMEGELLLLGVATDSASLADIDTTGASSDVYNMEYYEFNRRTGRSVKKIIRDETGRNTVAGLAPATDPKLIQHQIVFSHAWGPVPPGCDWTLVGRVRIDLRTAA